MATPQLPTIPTVMKGNVDNNYEVLTSMKMYLEMLSGARGSQPASRTFVQADTPTAYSVGDMWIQPSNGHISYWDGVGWRLTKAVP